MAGARSVNRAAAVSSPLPSSSPATTARIPAATSRFHSAPPRDGRWRRRSRPADGPGGRVPAAPTAPNRGPRPGEGEAPLQPRPVPAGAAGAAGGLTRGHLGRYGGRAAPSASGVGEGSATAATVPLGPQAEVPIFRLNAVTPNCCWATGSRLRSSAVTSIWSGEALVCLFSMTSMTLSCSGLSWGPSWASAALRAAAWSTSGGSTMPPGRLDRTALSWVWTAVSTSVATSPRPVTRWVFGAGSAGRFSRSTDCPPTWTVGSRPGQAGGAGGGTRAGGAGGLHGAEVEVHGEPEGGDGLRSGPSAARRSGAGGSAGARLEPGRRSPAGRRSGRSAARRGRGCRHRW